VTIGAGTETLWRREPVRVVAGSLRRRSFDERGVPQRAFRRAQMWSVASSTSYSSRWRLRATRKRVTRPVYAREARR
jgi:hypothetical protein